MLVGTIVGSNFPTLTIIDSPVSSIVLVNIGKISLFLVD